MLQKSGVHQLIGRLSLYLQGFIHPRWCRILSINSSLPVAHCLDGNPAWKVSTLIKDSNSDMTNEIWTNLIATARCTGKSLPRSFYASLSIRWGRTMSHDLTLNWRFRIRIPIFLVKLFRPRPSKRGPKRSVFGGFGRGKKKSDPWIRQFGPAWGEHAWASMPLWHCHAVRSDLSFMKTVTTRFSLKKVVDLCFGKSFWCLQKESEIHCVTCFWAGTKMEPGFPPRPAPETRV